MWPAAVCCDARGILEKATEALRKHFGFGSLRDFQSNAIAAWAEGKDVLIALGTGTGKSLCFQLPPVARCDGRCSLVISPLISLMQDQLRTLQQRQIPVSCCGAATGATLEEAVEAARGGVVYMGPEYALTRLSQLKKMKDRICLLAIDEAHCISAWGHDFRKSYQQLGQVRDALGRPPTMALTATCTNEVQKDIRRCLGLTPENTVLVQGSINRPNLKFVVRPRSTLEEDFAEIFHLNQAVDRSVENTSVNAMSSTIVYVLTRARSEEVANWFQMKGVKAAAYHAGLSVSARNELHRLFMLDQLQIMVATIAFGMGIDKPSIRRVIHYGGVQSMAHFMQQCGRAGRDGEDAECITFHRAQDAQEIRNVMLHSVETSSQVFQQRQLELNNELNAYLADSSQCRRLGLLRHFGERPKVISAGDPWVKGECVRVGETGEPNCQWCDVCLNPRRQPSVSSSVEVDFTAECLILLDCVFACGGFTGRGVPLQVAAGHCSQQVRSKKLHQHRAFGSGGTKSHSWWKAFLPHVLQRGLLQEKPARLASGFSYAAISLSEAGHTMLQTRCGSFLMCPVPEELNVVKAPAPSPVAVVRSSGAGAGAGTTVASSLEEKVLLLYRRLSHVRQQWMRRLNIMGESIISNPVLRALAEQRPCSLAEAQRLPGLPQTLQQDLGELLQALVEEIQTTCHDLSLPQSGPVADAPEMVRADVTKRKLPWDDSGVNVKVLRSSVLAAPTAPTAPTVPTAPTAPTVPTVPTVPPCSFEQQMERSETCEHSQSPATKETSEAQDDWLSLLEM